MQNQLDILFKELNQKLEQISVQKEEKKLTKQNTNKAINSKKTSPARVAEEEEEKVNNVILEENREKEKSIIDNKDYEPAATMIHAQDELKISSDTDHEN